MIILVALGSLVSTDDGQRILYGQFVGDDEQPVDIPLDPETYKALTQIVKSNNLHQARMQAQQRQSVGTRLPNPAPGIAAPQGSDDDPIVLGRHVPFEDLDEDEEL
jgi:hypothetical protein